jgi:hypothetical protein
MPMPSSNPAIYGVASLVIGRCAFAALTRVAVGAQ